MRLLGVAMLPVIVSIIFYIIKRKTDAHDLPFITRQITVGVVFGIVSICATLFGVDVGGATANCRDAAPLCAGFFFGGPAGIIAGIIGGVHRWISAPTTGMYTRVACSVSTVVAGIYAAALRKYFFEFRRPGWMMAALVGLVMEVFHMTMVFITHVNDVQRALEIIKIVTVPMVVCNAFAVGLAALIIDIISKKVFHRHGDAYKKKINERIQARMLVAVIVAFILATSFIFAIQTMMAISQTEKLIDTNVTDVVADIQGTIDKDMLKVAHKVADAYDRGSIMSLNSMAGTYEITEINIVDDDGYIIKSNYPVNVGYNMKSSSYTSAFMILTRGMKELVQPYTYVEFGNELEPGYWKYAGVALKDGGFIQVGYDQVSFDNKVKASIVDITKNRHIGNTGGIYIMDENLNIVSATYGADTQAHPEILLQDGYVVEPKTLFTAWISGKQSLCKYDESEGYYILAYLPVDEAMNTRDLEIYLNAFLEVLVFAMIFAWIFFLIKKLVVNNIYKVNDSLEKITGGDLEEQVHIHDSQEFDELSNAINQTVERLEQYTEEVKKKIEQELEIAKNIQQSSLPQNFEEIDSYDEVDIYATMNPAKEVGGDFYDFQIRDDILSFGVADVSGKGIPGAMFMMRAKTMLKSCVDSGMEIDETFTITNRKLCEGNEAEMFVTGWMGMLDIRTGHVDFANAGHNPPVIYRSGEGYSYLKSKVNLVLAGMDGIRYKRQELELNPGDKIFLYTDGVVEAQNSEHELYGEERLLECLNAHKDADETETIEQVRKDLDFFVNGAEQFDDITMLVVRYNGVPKKVQ